jgi:hypothetical protein
LRKIVAGNRRSELVAICDHLARKILKLPEPIAPSKVFDFALQSEVNKELGIR